PGAAFVDTAIVVLGLALFFFAVQWLLSRGHADAPRSDRPIILALNLIFLLTAAAALIIEPDKRAALQGAEGAIIALLSSFAGAWFAAHRARHQLSARPH
ncbi:MAG TPA: hypothetical protein VLB75_02430, partial [Steroidobacteraceae bacterium]|nr:hypothetical protein [Steroidobacteraceae bacterium]